MDQYLRGNEKCDPLSKVEYTRALLNLGRMLEKHHRSKVVILIDEYDTPIQQGHSRNFYNEVITFMRNFMSRTKAKNELSLDQYKAELAGHLFCGSVTMGGEIDGNPKIQEAYDMGAGITHS